MQKNNQMMGRMIYPIARIHTDFPEKFGIPRQSGLTGNLKSRIEFEPEYAKAEALRGIEEFSHLWLIWGFSENVKEDGAWSPTVRPPRLGGNKRVGVFATRSSFRPNALALSVVRLEKVESGAKGAPALIVTGADLMDDTPIYDIKPYIPFADSHPEALGGFTDRTRTYKLKVEIPDELIQQVPEEKREAFKLILSQDPRPSYQEDPSRIYGMDFAGLSVKFKVNESLLTVTEIGKLQ